MGRLGRLESLGGWIAAASFVVFGAMVADTALAAAPTGISGTKHNLGSTGSGTINTSSTTEICVFCHTPHGGNTAASAPLWNRGAAAGSFTVYDGLFGGRPSTLDGTAADGNLLTVGSISAMCLSCHDGATALDLLINKPGSGGYNSAGASAGYSWTGVTGTNQMLNSSIANIGQDLKNDHPIGVAYCGGKAAGTTGPVDIANCKDADFNVASTANSLFWVDSTGGTSGVREKTDMMLYVRDFGSTGTGNWPSVECGSCHDPHSTNDTFLRIANTNSQLCLTCHKK